MRQRDKHPSDFPALYREAFSTYGTRALWNRRGHGIWSGRERGLEKPGAGYPRRLL